MNKTLALILLIGFAAIALGGFLALDHANEFTYCAASLTGSPACPVNDSGLGMNLAHAKIFTSFSLTKLTPNLAFLLSLLFFFAFFPILLSSRLLPVFSQTEKLDTAPATDSKSQTLAWLAILEKKDPVFPS